MESIKFSVAISVYRNDDAKFFERALASITEYQTIMPNEIILVVDGTVDDELNRVIEKYENKYLSVFKVIRLRENAGLGNALRIAVENASFEWIARMDSDDISLPSRFEEELMYITANAKVDIVGGDISEFIDSEENIVAYRKVPKSDNKIKEYLKKRCPFNHMSVMYKKSAVEAAGGYRDLFWNEDYYLWIRMAENGAFMGNTGTVLVNVRTGKDMYKRRGGKKYYQSEKFLQNYMLERKMISKKTYLENICKRWIIQRLLPSRLRGWIFRTFARKD